MKKIFLFSFCLLLALLKHKMFIAPIKIYLMSLVPKRTPIVEERCKLDIYYPENKKDFSTIVWFHGGGMEGGNKFIPKELREQGFAVVAVNYRLSPKAKNPAYIEDAAEAVAWVFKNIEKYGGRKDHILFPVILREVIFR